MQDCVYCTQDERLDSLMIPLCQLRFSSVYLLRDQKYAGRCVVAARRHVREIYDLTVEERRDFFDDVADTAQGIGKVFLPDKINYAVYGDLLPHFHMHLVPKKEGGLRWGEPFLDTDAKQCGLEQNLLKTGRWLLDAIKSHQEMKEQII